MKLAEELNTRSSDVSDRRGRKRKRTEKGRDWDRETSVSGEQPSRQQSSSEEKANNKKQENESIKKKSPKKKKGETSKKAKEKRLQKTAEIASRQSLAAQFFGTVADTEKQGDDKDRNTPIITVHDHDSDVELSVTNKQLTGKQNRTTTFQSPKNDHARRNTTFTRDLTTVNVRDDSPISPALAATLAPVNFSVMMPINTPSPPSRGGTPTNPKKYTTLSQPDYVSPSATPTSDRHPVTMAPNRSPAESLNNRQQENEDFGGLFRSSLSLAYGDHDNDTGNIPQPEYSFLEDLNESGPESSPESPMAASNSSSTCANCEHLKRQIDVLKRNQMPGTHLQ